ncbi:hypothetical protein KEM48_008454 [Puccinia striiformis f. sp. tritici PST-130]|nr:hypothetical protein KEM48_008454 [Puccinia striiformis f. sp. tritici PST-130]
MSAFTSLSGALLLALSLNHVSAQIPANVSPCVRNCATVKVSEGYCSNPQIFGAAYDQCLRQNCNQADIAAGLPLTPVICGAAGSRYDPPTGAPGANTTAPLPSGTPVPAGNTTGAIPNALRAAGAGTLATIIGSPAGQSYVSQLQQGPHTVFAPVDSALAQLPLNSTSPADLTALLNYHTVPGTLDVARLPPNGHAIVRTALRGAPHVNLRDSQCAHHPWYNRCYRKCRSRASSLAAAVNTVSPQLFGELDQTPGLTIFAPVNAALTNLPPNTNFQGVLLNHIVNGTVLYSTTIANVTTATSAGGSRIDFINNATAFKRHSELPLVNQNNQTETAGITQVEGANLTSPAAQNAQSAGLRSVSLPGSFVTGFAMLLLGAFVL